MRGGQGPVDRRFYWPPSWWRPVGSPASGKPTWQRLAGNKTPLFDAQKREHGTIIVQAGALPQTTVAGNGMHQAHGCVSRSASIWIFSLLPWPAPPLQVASAYPDLRGEDPTNKLANLHL